MLEKIDLFRKDAVENPGDEDQEDFFDNSEASFDLMQLVYNLVVKELVRQVSTQCLERGWVLHRIFDAYKSLIESSQVLYNKRH